jgi:hypothetical protein
MKLIFVRIVAVCAFSAVFAGCTARSETPLPAVPAADVAPSDVESAATARILSYHLMSLRSRSPLTGVESDGRVRYPADLVRRKGPIMTAAASFNIYVNCSTGGESCWGDPEGFEKNLTGSSFAALLEQYTQSPPSGYTFGGAFNVKYHTFTKLFYQNDLLAVLHAALVRNGKKAGYSNMYHIFLTKGTDTCFDRTRSCYSPQPYVDE